MKSTITLVGLALAATVFVGAVCDGRMPPGVPVVEGPSASPVLDTLTFRVMAEDPAGEDVQYKLDYGDGSPVEWTVAGYPSGLRVSFKHAFAEAGSFQVRAMARNEAGLESDWSEAHPVSVELWDPAVPPPPDGPTTCTTGVTYFFSATTTHPRGDSLWFQFDWGDTVGNWSGPVPSGSSYTGVRSWSEAGSYPVRVRARDADERTSGWSEPLAVTVIKPSGGPPTGFRLAAAGSGLTVQLSWTRPAAGTPAEYVVLFREGAEFSVVARPTQAFYVHDPGGKTGDYLVAARFDTTLYYAGDTLNTRPVHSPEMTIYELNGAGNQGYGWSVATGAASAHDMGDAANAPLVDLFCTDFAVGHGGAIYTVVSPTYGPTDPGGGVPPGDWRESWFAHVTGGEHDPLPAYAGPPYRQDADIGNLPMRLAVYTAERHYALLRVNAVDNSTGTVRLESWFQPVSGLRLIAH
ncbi:MAG TPA: hypothetical protein ENN51_00840 [candidate division WOR-3 bacterium]|uniref:PKD domain-containing protein n=1 Tax=candidate division WOR-3 bacterium TaxID=2052148 RepID=A0A7V0T4T9_UNCW3|nr:hypothetical protein [candidate division WOR-3 bacterium]